MLVVVRKKARLIMLFAFTRAADSHLVLMSLVTKLHKYNLND